MELIRKIYEAGVVGAGGAGFPTHKKLNCKVEYLILNGAECEPLLKSDQYLMRNMSSQLVSAAELIGDSVGASRIIFALKKKYVNEADSIKEAIEKTGARAEIFYMDGIYPAGDEQILVYEVTGRTVEPGGIPLSVGTVVININTVFNVSEAVNNRAVTFRYVTVNGEVKKPVIVKAPLGSSVSECIEAAGGTDLRDYSVIMGGPMMGKLLDRQQVENRYITKTDGGIIIIPADHYLVKRDSMPIEHIVNQAKSACIQCSYCTEMCPRYLIGHQLRPHRIMRSIAMGAFDTAIYNEALICCECGICELYACPMGLSPRKVNIYLKNKLRSKGVKFMDSRIDSSNTAMRDFRKIPQSRLIGRVCMAKYDRKIDNTVAELHPEKVCIPLKQHIGASAIPVIKPGEEVREGQLIAASDYDGMGANVHASIAGRIEAVSNDCIVITAADRGDSEC
ncbi:MAG TPA: 4Fe-4S dicluster domain-containing protein [Clostridia bacterium]|nr:4Fe-4S dicluster domain-containing protein [Clostridia bacterium]